MLVFFFPIFQPLCPSSCDSVHKPISFQTISSHLPTKIAPRLDLLTLLLDAGADINGRDSTQWTALHTAARTAAAPHCTSCVQLLLYRRADAFAATELAKLGTTWQISVVRHLLCKLGENGGVNKMLVSILGKKN